MTNSVCCAVPLRLANFDQRLVSGRDTWHRHLYRADATGADMPIFMIERRFTEDFLPSVEKATDVNLINDEEGVRWLFSFLSADMRKTYCLYEAESADAIVRAAERAGLPADVVIPLGHQITRHGELVPVES